MKREYGAEVVTSPPRVAYRETITKAADFDYTHKKQTGGSGQFGRVVGYVEPFDEQEYEFVDLIKVVSSLASSFLPATRASARCWRRVVSSRLR